MHPVELSLLQYSECKSERDQLVGHNASPLKPNVGLDCLGHNTNVGRGKVSHGGVNSFSNTVIATHSKRE